MKILSTLRTKPWLQPGQRPELVEPTGLRVIPGQLIGLTVFLIVAASLFALFSISYQYRMDYQDWRPAPEPWQLWMNTVLLLMASLALQIASHAARRKQIKYTKQCLSLAGAFTWLFLLGQAWVWTVMTGDGYTVNANPANSFFYLITAVHAAHIIGGLVAWGRTILKSRRQPDAQSMQLSIRLCAMYWHFLLVVWLFLFYMLLVT